MRTIRFARRHHPEDETKGAELFLVLDRRLPLKPMVVRFAFGQPG
jgi:hypothetical protein